MHDVIAHGQNLRTGKARGGGEPADAHGGERWCAFGPDGDAGGKDHQFIDQIRRQQRRGEDADLGLVDEYRLYVHPVVLGGGTPFFAGPRPPLRLVSSDGMGGDVIRLTYVPA